MDDRLPELVRDCKLDATVADGSTVEIKHVSNQATGLWRTRVEEKWDRVRKLGEGGFAMVWLDQCVTGPSAGKVRAVKELKTKFGSQTLASSMLSRELLAFMKFSQVLYQDCFVKSDGWYESPESIFITMEYMPLGDLEGYIQKETLPEDQSRRITAQLLQGLAFMHRDKFAHRDLKPGNILVQHKGPDWWVKISDFGTSKQMESTVLRTTIGTFDYQAPEVKGIYKISDMDLEDDPIYDLAVDIWAVGAIVFRIVTGRMAFTNQKELSRYVVLDGPFPIQDTLSASCTRFIAQTMSGSPRQRPTAEEALKDAWIVTPPASETAETITDESSMFKNDASAQWSIITPPTEVHDPPALPPRAPKSPTLAGPSSPLVTAINHPSQDREVTAAERAEEPHPTNETRATSPGLGSLEAFARASIRRFEDSIGDACAVPSKPEPETSQPCLPDESDIEQIHRFQALGAAAKHIVLESNYAVIASSNRAELWAWGSRYEWKKTLLEDVQEIHAVTFADKGAYLTIMIMVTESEGINRVRTWDLDSQLNFQPVTSNARPGQLILKAAFVEVDKVQHVIVEWLVLSTGAHQICGYTIKEDGNGHISDVCELTQKTKTVHTYLSPRGGYFVLFSDQASAFQRLGQGGEFGPATLISGPTFSDYPLAMSPLGQVLVFSTGDELMLYEYTGPSYRAVNFANTQSFPHGKPTCCAFSVCGRMLAVGYHDGSVTLLTSRGGRYSKTRLVFGAHLTALCALAFDPSATVLLTGASDQSIASWQIPSELRPLGNKIDSTWR